MRHKKWNTRSDTTSTKTAVNLVCTSTFKKLKDYLSWERRSDRICKRLELDFACLNVTYDIPRF